MTPRNLSRQSIGSELVSTTRTLGKEPLPWQADAFDVAFEVDAFGILWYREIVIVVPRQSGKTTLVIPWGVHRCLTWPDRQFMVYTAQTREKALEKLVEEQFYWINRSPFRRLLLPNRSGKILPNLSHGAEHMRWRNGSKWSIDAPTETAGHGSTLNLGVGDEIFAHADARVEAAMSPAMVTVDDAQKLWISTAGKTKKKSPFLWSKVEAGRNRVELQRLNPDYESRSLYIEFSAPEDADFLDTLVWWQTMPALGYTQTLGSVSAQLETLGEWEFRRAFLNQWADEAPTEWKIPATDWFEVEDSESQISDQLTWVIDVNPERTWASIGVAAQRPDGLVHIEVIETHAGTGWVIEGDPTRGDESNTCKGIAALVAEHGGEVYYDHITVGALVPDLLDAGLHPIPIPLQDIKVASAALFDAVKNRTVRHIGQKELTDALAAAATRKVGDGWAWARGPSMADITPLMAVTLAFWMLAKTLPDLNYDPMSGIG